MRWIGKITLWLALVAPSSAHAEESAQKMLQIIEGGNKVVAEILSAWAYGMQIANVVVTSKGGAALFCPPQKIAITTEQDVDILKRYIEANPSKGTAPASIALMLAYEDAFPCE